MLHLAFRTGEKTDALSPEVDFSQGPLELCGGKCWAKVNFPPSPSGSYATTGSDG